MTRESLRSFRICPYIPRKIRIVQGKGLRSAGKSDLQVFSRIFSDSPFL